MEKLVKLLNILKDYFLFIVIIILLGIIFFKNQTISNLKKEINTPIIEYKDSIITIRDSIPYLKDTVIYKNIPLYDTIVNNITVKENISKEDSLKIFEELSRTLSDYNSLKLYENVIKDDSTAYLKYNAKVQYNHLYSIDFKYENRTPYYIKEVIPIKTNNVYMGLDIYKNGIFINSLFKSKKDWYIKLGYDPINKQTLMGGGIKLF